jgi:putative ABC transport system permease protein
MIESFLVAFSGIVIGVIMIDILGYFAPFKLSFGLDIYQFFMLFSMLVIAVIASFFPALKSYKNSLSDGLLVRM